MKTLRILACVSLLGCSGAFAAGKTCPVAISAGDNMMYDKKEITVGKDCTEVEVTLTHSGKLPAAAMGHNWVLAKTSDMAGVVSDGAGATPDHVKAGDARVIAHTKLIGGGESTVVKFQTSALKAGESYSFFCTMPGHWTVMKGAFKIG
jgi:azurin